MISQEPNKILKLLKFAFNAKLLKEYVREKWIKLYDYEYIDEKIISTIESNQISCDEIIIQIEGDFLGTKKKRKDPQHLPINFQMKN